MATQDILQQIVLAELAKCSIIVIAYSPLCRGSLSNSVVGNGDMLFSSTKPDAIRVRFERHNLRTIYEPQSYMNLPMISKNVLLILWRYRGSYQGRFSTN